LNAEFSRGYHYEPSTTQSRFDQRKRYQDAIYYITSGQRSRYLKVKDSLRNYPLYPYLEYTDMAYRISRQSVEDMRTFADQYQDTPLPEQLIQHYLHNGQMLRRFNNNRILASAAYNAGPSRVDRWINDQLPFDVWIETIPFIETRNYVQNVLILAAIYGRQLNLEQPMIYAHEYLDFSDTRVTATTDANVETF
jgi:hypothetical protein